VVLADVLVEVLLIGVVGLTITGQEVVVGFAEVVHEKTVEVMVEVTVEHWVATARAFQP